MFNIKINIQSQPLSIKHVLGPLECCSVHFEDIHLSTWAPHCYALTINKSIDEKYFVRIEFHRNENIEFYMHIKMELN
jgi:hypothetical protein